MAEHFRKALKQIASEDLSGEMSQMTLTHWFTHEKINEGLYLITEPHFIEGCRCNCWLIKGPSKDVLIDTGLGVCNMREYLQEAGLVEGEEGARPCEVVLTHAHFDHSGGAHHFTTVSVHSADAEGVKRGRQTVTLNYVKPAHFLRQPYSGFSAFDYKVPSTPCQSLSDGDMIDMGGGEHLEILHTPGHTLGSLSVYYPQRQALFTGDFVYDTGDGSNLLDWLPTSDVSKYVNSAKRLLEWLTHHPVDTVYPGHFCPCTSTRVQQLLMEYVESKDGCTSHMSATCIQRATWCFFVFGCFRCCPC